MDWSEMRETYGGEYPDFHDELEDDDLRRETVEDFAARFLTKYQIKHWWVS